jgi:hypothetical protein
MSPLHLRAARFGAFGVATCLFSLHASADFAPPPHDHDGVYVVGDRRDLARWERGFDPAAYRTPSTVRFHVGPAALLDPGTPGLYTALDIGQRSVGARLSGAWLRAESESGLSQYSGEIWVDFRRDDALHPIIGAGAAWLRGAGAGSERSAGAGVLRVALEYELPVADSDARLGLNLGALVPAIGSERETPWLTGALTVGAGF